MREVLTTIGPQLVLLLGPFRGSSLPLDNQDTAAEKNCLLTRDLSSSLISSPRQDMDHQKTKRMTVLAPFLFPRPTGLCDIFSTPRSRVDGNNVALQTEAEVERDGGIVLEIG